MIESKNIKKKHAISLNKRKKEKKMKKKMTSKNFDIVPKKKKRFLKLNGLV